MQAVYFGLSMQLRWSNPGYGRSPWKDIQADYMKKGECQQCMGQLPINIADVFHHDAITCLTIYWRLPMFSIYCPK